MQDFAAIDFETANYQRSSVCSVGVIIVRGGRIADRFYSPVSLSVCRKGITLHRQQVHSPSD